MSMVARWEKRDDMNRIETKVQPKNEILESLVIGNAMGFPAVEFLQRRSGLSVLQS